MVRLRVPTLPLLFCVGVVGGLAGAGPAGAAGSIVVGGHWVVLTDGDAVMSCDIQMIQYATAPDNTAPLTWSGTCDTAGSVALLGDIDVKSGAYDLSGVFLGAWMLWSGQVAPDGASSNGSWVVTQFPAGGTFLAARETTAGDTDGDGCNNAAELGPDEMLGGRRHPVRYWDFMDVPAGEPLARDAAVSIGDIAEIVFRFGSDDDVGTAPINRNTDPLSTPPETGYHPAYDRGGVVLNGEPWDLAYPDGSISVGDIGAAVIQFGHNCM